MASLLERLKRQFDTNDGGATFANPTPRKQVAAVTPALQQRRTATNAVTRLQPLQQPRVSQSMNIISGVQNAPVVRVQTPRIAAPKPQEPTKAIATAPKSNVPFTHAATQSNSDLVKSAGTVGTMVRKNIIQPTVNTVSKSANTVAALAPATTGLAKGITARVTGNKVAEQNAVNTAMQQTSRLLNKGGGLGHQGAFVTPKQAVSSGDGWKGLKENYIKPTSQAVAEVAPLVIPAGSIGVGAKASIAARAAAGATQNAAVTALTDPTNQYIQNGKVDWKQAAANTALNTVVGGALPIVAHGTKVAAPKVATAVLDPAAAANTFIKATDKIAPSNQAGFIGSRLNLDQQGLLRDFSDVLAGVSKQSQRDQIRTLNDGHALARQLGIDMNVAPRFQVENVNAVLDSIGMPNRQGGYIKVPGSSKPDPLAQLKQEAKPYTIPKTNSTDVTKLSDKDLEYFAKQGYTSITDRYGNTRQIKPVKTDGTQKLDSLNPTGGVYVDYTPQTRATMPLADNMTTYDKTAGRAPDELVTIYRGAPKNQKVINPGDFITTNKELAKSYTGDGNVLEMKVPASHILDDKTAPLGEEYLYRPSNQAHAQPQAPVAQPKVEAPQPTVQPKINIRPDAESRVFSANPMEPKNQAIVQQMAKQSPKVEPVKVTVPQKTAEDVLGRQLTYGERAALDKYLETGNRDEALRAYQDTFVQRGLLYGGERKSQANVERIINAHETANAPTFAKVKQANTENNIPVMRQTRQGDVVTATNVNPNIKAKEKRYTLGDDGKLIEDKKGAYSIFSDEEGRVSGFRVGDEYFSSKDLGDLSDVNDYGSTLATMRRNVERSFGKETADKVSRFLVDDQQSRATSMINRQVEYKKGLEQLQQDLGISFKIGRGKAKKVSADIQNYGEGVITKAELEAKYGKDYAGKIIAADRWFRSQYDSLLSEMNDTLTKFGYDPVPKRKNYYTHFQEPSLWQSFGLKMQEIRNLASPTMQDATPGAARGSIKNSMAGMSEFTQPNKRFNPFAQKRTGEIHTADAFGAFERYLSPTLNNIYMTPSITRARVLARAIAQDADLTGKDANGIITQTREWANRLAGKSNRFDRPIVDSKWGRGYLKFANWAQRKAGQNTIIGNLSSAIMQPIVLAQTAGKFGYKNTLLGIMQEMGPAHTANAPIRQSAFMRRRYADVSSVTSGKMDAARNVANKPMEIVEETATRATWNAAYNDAVSKGLKGDKAIRYADIETERTVAGRSIGEKPELFDSKATGPLTMYQLEVNNFWQQFGKEMVGQGHFGQAAKVMAATYMFNLALQQITGRQVGFNPIDAAIDSYEETQKEGKSAKDKAIAIGQRWAGEFVDNAPFVAPLLNTALGEKRVKSLTGNDSNTGRFGVSSPLSTLVTNPVSMVAPFGASQVKKSYQGVKAVSDGKITDKNGKTLVEVQRTPANYVRGALFGRNAIPEVNAYYNNVGKKKVDQKPVPNQTTSRAANMGPAASGENISTEDRIKQAFTTEEGKAMLALKTDAERQKQYPELYTQYKAMKTAVADNSIENGRPDNFDSLTTEAKKFYDTQAKLTEDGKKKWLSSQAQGDVAKLVNRANSRYIPDGFDKLPNTNKVAGLVAKFEADVKKNKWSSVRLNTEKKKMLKEAYTAALDDNESYLFGANDNDMYDAIQNGEVSQDTMDKLVALDNTLIKLGGSTKISNKLRRVLGYDDAPKLSGSLSSSSSSSGGSSKKLTSSILSNLSDIYTTSASNQKKLRELLGLTHMS